MVNPMKKLVLVLLVVSFGGIEAAKIRCVCNDKEVIMPECGICGVELGTMEKTEGGVACICQNRLKAQEISCAAVCKNNRGWSGEYK